jgi:acetyl-CoA carboxylase carboxyl transferase subunit alpha
MAGLKISTLAIVLGEGGSGGALAIGVSDRVLMMENAVYSVISPEGCAAILWKDAAQSDRAAESLRLTAIDLQSFGLVDEIIAEEFFLDL